MSMKSVYQILKAIDISYENQDFDFHKTFDLEQLKISEHRLNLILDNLFDEKYIDFTLKHEFRDFYKAPPREYKLTLKGMDYLEMDSTMKKIQVELTNPEEIAPELKEIVEILTSHVEILDEIRFLEADKMTIMKEKFIKLREEDKEEKIPWDSVINLVTTIASI